MAYSDTNTVRIFAGMVGNLNVTTASIQVKITMADGIINGKLYDVYTLPLAETPAMIQAISAQLAASLVLQDEYGVESEGTDKDDEKMWKKAMGVLDEIRDKKLKLVSDTTGAELATNNVRTIAYSPSNTTQNATDTTSSANKFSMNDQF